MDFLTEYYRYYPKILSGRTFSFTGGRFFVVVVA